MSTLLYSPGIEVMIDTLGKGIVDVSEDISSASLTLTENQVSSFSMNLINHRRKYDGLFTPNDIVVVKLKRITWLPVFSGYLDEVPYFSVYPKTVHLSASCTLKRLQMQVWDAGSPAAYALLSPMSQRVDHIDGGVRDQLITLLSEVAGWDKSMIHIGQIPADWSEKLKPLYEKLHAQILAVTDSVGTSGAVNGTSPLAKGLVGIQGGGPGTGILPAQRGRAGVLTTAGTTFSLSGESRSKPNDQFYMAMRWPYKTDDQQAQGPHGTHLTAGEEGQARRWWKNRKMLVVNPNNNKAVVLRAVEWGPANVQGTALLSAYALQEVLEAKEGTNLEYRFAAPDMVLGRYVDTTPTTTFPGGHQGGYPGQTQTPEAQAPVVYGESGGAWKGRERLQPHTTAAMDFIKANFSTGRGIGGYVEKNIGNSGKRSDHATGRALDVSISAGGTKAVGAELALGNAVAMWFVANPNVFGTKYVIWQDRINSGSGWKRYSYPGAQDNTTQHRDHVHLSFNDGVQTEAGPMGNGWNGGTPADFNNYVSTTNGVSPDPGGPSGGGPGGYDVMSGLKGPDGMPLLNAYNWLQGPSDLSGSLWGYRVLLNDTPILASVAEMVLASMRSYMSAPNGDFIAWFPDYFGIYGTASKLLIRDIELIGEGFTIAWSDSHLVTHQFTAGSATGYAAAGSADEVTVENQLTTMGIATVEFPELMEALFNIGPGGGRGTIFSDAEAIFRRFGARVNYTPIGTIYGQEQEFWMACRLFMESWAAQFSSNISLSFMPEVWPGMLVKLDSFKFQAYVTEVVHNIDFSDDAGFTTEVRVIAPSTSDRASSGFYALPLSGDAPPPRTPAIVTGPNRDPRSKYL